MHKGPIPPIDAPFYFVRRRIASARATTFTGDLPGCGLSSTQSSRESLPAPERMFPQVRAIVQVTVDPERTNAAPPGMSHSFKVVSTAGVVFLARDRLLYAGFARCRVVCSPGPTDGSRIERHFVSSLRGGQRCSLAGTARMACCGEPAGQRGPGGDGRRLPCQVLMFTSSESRRGRERGWLTAVEAVADGPSSGRGVSAIGLDGCA